MDLAKAALLSELMTSEDDCAGVMSGLMTTD